MRIRTLLATVALASSALVGVAATPAHAVDPPQVRVGDVTTTEPDAGTTLVKVPIDLSVPALVRTRIPYTIHPEHDGVTDGADAVSTSGVATFPIGVASRVVTATIVGDGTTEPDQHVVVTLGAPILGIADLVDPNGEVTIRDNDANGVAPGVEVSVGDATVTETDGGAHLVYVPVTLSQPAPSTIRIAFRLGCSTLVVGRDAYASSSSQVTIRAGRTSGAITISVAPDYAPEDLESLVESVKAIIGPATVAQDSGELIVENDDPGVPPTFIDHLQVGERAQISIADDGTPAQYEPVPNGGGDRTSNQGSLSLDGRYAVFMSDACNLVSSDTNGMADVFVRDRATGHTERVSLNADGSEIVASEMRPLQDWGRVAMWAPTISGNGRYVGFVTAATLMPQDTSYDRPNASWISAQDGYLYDRVTKSLELISVAPDGTAGGGLFGPLTMSDDGRYVLFDAMGQATTIADMPYNQHGLFLRDRTAGTTTRLPDGMFHAKLSGDGEHILWDDGASPEHVFSYDVATATNDAISVTDDEQPILTISTSYPYRSDEVQSDDGRYVAFVSYGWNLIPGATGVWTGGARGDELAYSRIYLRDRVAGTTTMLSDASQSYDVFQNFGGTLSMSADGSTVAMGNGGGQGFWWATDGSAHGRFGFPPGADGPNNMIGAPNALTGDGSYVIFSSETWPYADEYVERIR
jgi:Tol biopolymer transport system component